VTFLVRIIAVVIAVFAAVPAPVEASTESRLALVIGNARYPDAPLRNAANDARAMATTLRERGFEVILRVDAGKQQMESAIIEFGEKLSQGATGLFFFAGHGMQVQGRNYIIPTDARLSSEQRVKLETIDVEAVLDQMQGARSRVNVVILDACRNNPFERRFRSASGGLAQISAPEGTLIAYATAPGRVAADGDGANGLYTAELLKALRAPGLRVEDVFKQVRTNVARVSNGAQTPWEASSLVGDFYFTPAAATVAAPATPVPVAALPAAAPNIAEIEFWNSIRNSNEAGEFRAYLSQYPRGEFAALARLRIDALERGRTTTAALPANPPPVARDRLKPETLTAQQKSALGFPITYADLDGRQYFAQQNFTGGHRGVEIKFDFAGKDPARFLVNGRLEIETGGGKGGGGSIVPFVTCSIYGFDRFKQNLQFTAYCNGNFMVVGDLSKMSVGFMLPGLTPTATLIDSDFSDRHREWTKGVWDNNTSAFFQDVLKETLIKSASSGN